MKRVMLCLAILLTIASPAAACIGARQAAMGWCGVAISDDATASYWNPAAIVWARDGVMYGSIFGGIDSSVKYNDWGCHFVKDWDKQYFRISYGHQINNRTAIGCNIGWFSYVDGHQHPSLDLSLLHKFNNFSFGLLAQNVGNIRPEIAYHTDYFTAAIGFYDLFDICKRFNGCETLRDFHAGIELRPFSFLSLRGGYNTYYGITCGLGIAIDSLTFDVFAYPQNTYFSLSFDLLWLSKPIQ